MKNKGVSLLDNKNLPIGIFDSGVGGLTILRALSAYLPHERFLYLGDTARLPYGTKSANTVRNYALNVSQVLKERQIKLLVVACNTASAVALKDLQEKFHPVPVIGVIESGTKAALALPNEGPIVVLATEGTVKGQAYRRSFLAHSPKSEIIEYPCQLWVALAEEGWCQGELVEKIIFESLTPLFSRLNKLNPACMLLACTHFPVLKTAIAQVLPHIPIVDPADTVANLVKVTLEEQNLIQPLPLVGSTQLLATDNIERFVKMAEIFLGQTIETLAIELVNVPVFSEATILTTVIDKVISSGNENTSLSIE